MRKTIVLLISIGLFLGCSAVRKTPNTNAALDALMTQKTIEIAITTAEPLVTQAMSQIANSGLLQPGNSISRMDVAGQGYFIKIAGDSVAASLPYFGERQMGGGYNANGGIVFKGLAKNLEILKDETDFGYVVRFSIRAESETFDVNTVLGTTWSAATDIRSSHRNRIRYMGKVLKTSQNLKFSKN